MFCFSAHARVTQAKAMRVELDKLTLSNRAIWEREESRPPIKAPWVIKAPYFILCYVLDTVFDGRPLPRLWFLETVARVPYFSYISMLHLYESLGWWRIGAAVKRVHFAEEWNEMHHLLIMESLGGDRAWIDRFMAGHAAVIYYWVLVLMWLLSPTLAYNFSELIEAHAVDTYGQFVDENAERLRALPAPRIAQRYYTQDLYMYDEVREAARTRERELSSRLRVTRLPKTDELTVDNHPHAVPNEPRAGLAPPRHRLAV
jgi:ubiquinol oxidase